MPSATGSVQKKCAICGGCCGSSACSCETSCLDTPRNISDTMPVMTLPRPTIVIFDMDGTAVRHVNPALLHILEWMDDISFLLVRFFRWLLRRRAQGPILPPGEEPKAQRPPRLLVHRALHKFRRKSVEQIVQPCPGLFEVLEFLKMRGIPLALISNGLGSGYGHEIMEKFALEQYFPSSVFREDSPKSKPSPEPLKLALERLNISPKSTDVIWYIGDRHKDVTAALALRNLIPAKVEPIAFGLNAAIAVLEKGVSPDHIIMSFYDMRDRLEDLFQA